MSFRVRLTVIYATILTAFFLCFAGFSYFMVRQTLFSALDSNLRSLTDRVIDSAKVFEQGELTVVNFPEDIGIFRSASIFMIVANNNGEIVSRSNNLAGYQGLLVDINSSFVNSEFKSVDIANQNLRVLTRPLIVNDSNAAGGQRIIGFIQMGQLMDTYQDALNQLGVIMVVTGGAVFVFFLFMGAGTTAMMLRPLAEITSVALQITRADDLSRRIPDRGRNDEIGDLTHALNQTFERLEMLFHSQQRLLADVSHELRTPLTTIRGNLDLMQRMGEMDEDSIEIMQDELKRMSRLVGDLLLLARADGGSTPLRKVEMELDTVFFDVYRQIQPLCIEKNIEVKIVNIEPVRIAGDIDRLRQLLLILVDNGIKYTPPGGTLSLELFQKDGRGIVKVTDSGPGIPEEHLPHIFDRFYRVDKARSRHLGGSGLGLSIAYWIVKSHQAEMHVESEVGVGTTFIISFETLNMMNLGEFSDDDSKDEQTGSIRIPLPGLRTRIRS
ncbi:MAG: two-component system OmpR family sensor kinase [Candidatus Promineifilaceae bacterium]|jgi:two-component system OmpR family sensor kinase